MHQQPLLSIIVTFHNQRDLIEPTLSALYEMKSIPFELFILDDASTDGSTDTIQSLLDHYQHEQTYYFERTEPIGRGNCLNEALQQCSGSVLWIPRTVEQIHEELLHEAASHLYKSSFTFYCDVDWLPSSPDQWIEFIGGNTWPDDGAFLWNLNLIPPRQQFFNPYLDYFQGLELSARLNPSSKAGQIEPWYTPVREEPLQEITPEARVEMACTLLKRRDLSKDQRRRVFDLLNEQEINEQETDDTVSEPAPESVQDGSYTLIAEAEQMKQDGRDHAALELVEHILAEQPDHQQARQLKIEILERQRRFVEASELKHEMSISKNKTDNGKEPGTEKIKTSIIIPTTLYGKSALEHCLVSLADYCNPETTELVVIDNASLDDTHDYLNELQYKNFFHCKVITNRQNAGFAASVNQGLELAQGKYACIMHNDVELTSDAIHQMEQFMDIHTEFAVIGPLAHKTLNPDQTPNNHRWGDGDLMSVDYLDSFCMMLRMDTGLRMDEAYQLAFFDDIDLCFQARKAGHKVGIATGVEVEHHFGATTFPLNLDTESDEYWKNIHRFNEKWGIEVLDEHKLKSKSRFDQLLALDDMVNPIYPEDSVTAWFERLFTDEVKTEILKSDHDPVTLCRLVHLMMVMDQREVMRRLEDRLDEIELPASLIYRLIRFYFNRNIYSRCNYYLNRLKNEERSLQSELYRLKILVNEKELEKAVPQLKALLEEAPDNPTLYKLAGDIYRFEGNEEEAASFYRIAHQINPFEYSPEGVEELRLSR